MSSLRMVEAKLPPGFRFHPRDDELVCDYLLKKWNGSESSLLIDVDLNKCEPWDIPETASVGLNVGGKEWYFYSQRDRKYATGLRTNRATISGYWKATGKDRPVIRKGNLVGMRKTLVFYQGRAPKGKKTDWVMHEYRVEGPFGPPKTSSSKEDWVLCRVFYKNKDQVPSRSSMENDSNSCYDETASSSLPPLTDSYISFEQTDHHPNSDSYQQVPCFSNYSPTQNTPTTFPPHNNIFQLDPINISTTNNTKNYTTTSHPTFGSGTSINIPDALATNTIISPLACDHDKKVIEAVLSHLTKMENSPNLKGSPPSLGEAASASNSESYLSEVNVWSHY